MSNELIFIFTVLIYLGSVLVLYRTFGKNGLFIFAVFGTLLGNIAVCKCVDIFGFSTTAGNVLYASTFLVTDILSEKYGRKRRFFWSYITCQALMAPSTGRHVVLVSCDRNGYAT